jgi:hypothetical protein
MSHDGQVILFLVAWMTVVEQGRLYSIDRTDLPGLVMLTRPVLFLAGLVVSLLVGFRLLTADWKMWLLWTVVGGAGGLIVGPMMTKLGFWFLEAIAGVLAAIAGLFDRRR